MLGELALKHGLHQAVEALNVLIAAGVPAQSLQDALQVAPHDRYLLRGAAEPDVGPLDIPVYAFDVPTLVALVKPPPLPDLSPSQDEITQEVLEFEDWEMALGLGDKENNRLRPLFRLGMRVEGLLQP